VSSNELVANEWEKRKKEPEQVKERSKKQKVGYNVGKSSAKSNTTSLLSWVKL
jgi:hypothetical protein